MKRLRNPASSGFFLAPWTGGGAEYAGGDC
jgi:hypothetical protein